MFKSPKKSANNLIRNVEVKAEFYLEPTQLWSLVENISNYPKYIKFVKYAWLAGPFEKGSTWIDLSTIIIFPVLAKHEILEVIYEEKAVFLIRLPFGGKIFQGVIIKPNKKGVEFKLTATINLGNKLVDMLLGRFVEKRTIEMLEDSLAKFSRNWL